MVEIRDLFYRLLIENPEQKCVGFVSADHIKPLADLLKTYTYPLITDAVESSNLQTFFRKLRHWAQEPIVHFVRLDVAPLSPSEIHALIERVKCTSIRLLLPFTPEIYQALYTVRASLG